MTDLAEYTDTLQYESAITVNLETSTSKLGNVLFHNNSYIRHALFLHNNSHIRQALFFTESSALLKMVKKLIFLRESAVFNIVSQSNIKKHKIPRNSCIF